MASSVNAIGDGTTLESQNAGVEAALDKFNQLYQAVTGEVDTKDLNAIESGANKTARDLVTNPQYLDLFGVKALPETSQGKTKIVQDDRRFFFEHLVQLLSALPSNSTVAKALTHTLINDLCAALPHPPVFSLDTKYKYRDADGGNNNIEKPYVGRANTAYGQLVRSSVLRHASLPDPGDIFDSIMVREKGSFQPHPTGISSMLFYLVSIIALDLFKTDHYNENYCTTSSYLDLAPLYGTVWSEQRAMRTAHDGKIKLDCFSEKRVLGLAPGVGVLLIMFNRYHNYIVDQLAIINENDRFTKPEADLPEVPIDYFWSQYNEAGHLKTSEHVPREEQLLYAWAKYDNDLFQTARLVNCGLYVNIILKDYVRTVLNLNSTLSPLDLHPRGVEENHLSKNLISERAGNQASAEFNLIYRWHSAISQRDDEWTQAEYKKIFPNFQDHSKITIDRLKQGLIDFERNVDKDPVKRDIPGLNRTSEGTFADEDMVEILTSSIEDVAGSFGSNKVPATFRGVEILGIMQARRWNLVSLNEFREAVGLERYRTFEDINPDPYVAQRLRGLYGDPDLVELYPGLVVEDVKPPMIGSSGLCVSFTISRAILMHVMASVKNDRFYTVDYTPKSLTNWAYKEVSYDSEHSQGHVMYKLICNAFPKQEVPHRAFTDFKGNSIYAHFPFVTPKQNTRIATVLGTQDMYDWSKPTRQPDLVIVNTYETAVNILNDKQTFRVNWGETITKIVEHQGAKFGFDHCLAGDSPTNEVSRELAMRFLYPDNWRAEVKTFYEHTTADLLANLKIRIGNKYHIDIVGDLAVPANTRFSSSLFSFPLNTRENPRGMYTEKQLYKVLSILYAAIFYDADSSKSFSARKATKDLAAQLGNLCMLNVEAISKRGVKEQAVPHRPDLTKYGIHIVDKLIEEHLSTEDVVWTHFIPTAASMVASQVQLFAQCLDFYLGDGSKYLEEIREAANQQTPKAEDKILRYFLEGCRIGATTRITRTVATDVEIHDGPSTLKVSQGQRVLVNVVKASLDPAVFPSPHEVRLDRDISSYLNYGWGPHQCAGLDISQTALCTMFRVVMKLVGLKRVPGMQGELRKIPAPYGAMYMQADWGGFSPIPAMMKVQWNG